MRLTFSQLSDKAKSRAISDFINLSGPDVFGYDYKRIFESSIAPKLKKIGITATDVYYSGFWSNEDGACFTTDWFSVFDYIKANKRSKEFEWLIKLKNKAERNGETFEVSGKIYKLYHDQYNENSVNLYTSTVGSLSEARSIDALQETYCESLLDEIFEYCKELMKEYYNKLKEEYNRLVGKIPVENFFHEYAEFDITGKRLR